MKKIEMSTSDKIEAALARIEKNRPTVVQRSRPLNIASLAEEAGFSRATIYRYYPEIVEKLRVRSDKTHQKMHGETNKVLKNERAKNRQLRNELKEIKRKYSKLASINATLTTENQHLKSLMNAGNVTNFPQK